uniref:alpha-N-acetylgalactosaminide alpha-2,6-sialyltransferase 5-like n=1 Tax=Myxine glutinosa TaxID=7769 RepID=UPI00358F804C
MWPLVLLLMSLSTYALLFLGSSVNVNMKWPKAQFLVPSPIHNSHLLPGYTRMSNQQPLQMHCNQCALVTSSGHLFNSSLGSVIDAAECVFRMNDAPTRAFEKDVGHRTTLRVVAHSSMASFSKHAKELLEATGRNQHSTVVVVWGPPKLMRADGSGSTYNALQRLRTRVPGLDIYLITDLRMQAFDRLYEKETGLDRMKSHTWLSTGWFTMGVLLDVCDHIHVYGMIPSDYCSNAKHHAVQYHYYEKRSGGECKTYMMHAHILNGGHHRFFLEKSVFARWAPRYNITFSHPSWPGL